MALRRQTALPHLCGGRGAWRLLVCVLALSAGVAAGREFEESADSPSAFVTVIHAREYDDRFETVEDLLHHAAGVRVRRFGALGSYSTASIRGSKAEQVLVLLDGVRLNSAHRGAVDLSTLSLRTIERIEIIRGGGSARYGSDAIGGVIVMTSRRPEGTGVDVSGIVGDLRTLGGDALVSLRGENLRAALSYSRLRSDGEFKFERDPGAADEGGRKGQRAGRGGETHRRLNADFVKDTGAVSSFLSTGPSSELSGTLHLNRKDGGQPGSLLGVPLTNVSDEQLSCVHGEEQYRRAFLRLGWRDQAFGPGAIEAGLYHRYERSELHDPSGLCNYFPALVFEGQTRSQVVDQQSGFELAFRGGRSELGPLAFSNRTSTALRLDRVRADGSDSKHRWVGTLYSQEEIRLFGGRVRVLPALGLDLSRTSEGEARLAGFRDPVAVDVEDDAAWLPGVGLIVTILPGLRAKSNYLKAFRRPNFSELFQPDFGFIRGNPTLKPEESWNFDAGFELATDVWGVFEPFHLEAVYFHRDVKESIEWVLLNKSFVPVNTGAARVRGYELRGSLAIRDLLSLSGSYTFTDTEIRLTGSPLPHAPRNQLFGRLALHVFRSTRLWLEVTHEDEHFLTEGGRREAPAATQIDVGISLRPADLPGLGWVTPRITLSVDGINMTEEQRVDSLGLPLPAERLAYLRLRFESF